MVEELLVGSPVDASPVDVPLVGASLVDGSVDGPVDASPVEAAAVVEVPSVPPGLSSEHAAKVRSRIAARARGASGVLIAAMVGSSAPGLSSGGSAPASSGAAPVVRGPSARYARPTDMTDEPRHPPTIELEGARLRPLRMADAAALHAYLRDPAVTELTSYPVMSIPMVEAMIDRAGSRWAAGELAKWGVALQHDDRLVGTCGFNEWSPAHRWAELAYDLAHAHWGAGLMRQAVAAALAWAFRQGQVDRVHAFVRVDNLRSERLLERGGFMREGRLRSYRVCRGQPYDFHIYALLRADWDARQRSGADVAPRAARPDIS